ncbi:histidine-containing phosphotransfer protein 2-like [Lotus japonicus]|uniref:histidine-containing phosphotransfer protein 2-like n=1 Tax=Lotus japonicus TaxID=34305 RepID=UPI00258C911B|nr:histidine-containing phosphotransfer protein 2-like [Lotus japonicus]
MALTAHKNRLQCFIQSMYDEGIVNEQFFQLQSMKEAIRPDFVVRAVTSFCLKQEVNFPKVHVLARELYARTTGVGAENVKRECAELLYASEMKDKNHCYQALYRIKNEFSYLRRKLETLVQVTVATCYMIFSAQLSYTHIM